MSRRPEVVLDAKADLGEGPWWDDARQELLWVDIFAGEVHAFNPRDGADKCLNNVGQPVGMVARRQTGGLVCAVRDGIGFIDDHNSSFTLALGIEADNPSNRMNDGACDPAGRLWAGTMASDLSDGQGCLYRIDAQLTAKTMLSGVSISNGLDWSADGKTFYHVDSTARRIDAYDFDVGDGTLSRPRPLVEMPSEPATPDGLALDAEDTVWVAMWDGGCVRRYRPNGTLLESIDLPVSRVTSVAFGGPGMSQLYITSARHGLSSAQLAAEPLAGAIFALDSGTCGVPPYRFGG